MQYKYKSAGSLTCVCVCGEEPSVCSYVSVLNICPNWIMLAAIYHPHHPLPCCLLFLFFSHLDYLFLSHRLTPVSPTQTLRPSNRKSCACPSHTQTCTRASGCAFAFRWYIIGASIIAKVWCLVLFLLKPISDIIFSYHHITNRLSPFPFAKNNK